jgi:colanic acid biosynthesis glycosyl transferase WcaI
MQILLLNQFFWPDTAATGQLLSDVADHLHTTGETVTVICGSARYGGATSAPQPKANIIRLKNGTFSRKVAGRMGSYLSFLAGALWHGMRVDTPDVVVTLTTPPLLSLIGLMIQKLRGARHIIWEMDVYPDVAVDLGVLKANGLAAKVFGWLADLPRRHADRIIVLGECMRARLLAHGIPSDKIVIVENWADGGQAITHANRVPKAVPTGKLSILYSGNFGLAHDVQTLSQALFELKAGSAHNVSFVFAGGGSRHAWLRNFCEEFGVSNATFLPYCEREELAARLASGDIGLVTQKNECLGSAIPSKTYGIMAAGRPVLFIGPKESTPALVIERYNCGWQIDCGDVQGLVQLLHLLDRCPELRIEAGLRARQAFLAHYQRSAGVSRIAEILGSTRTQEKQTPVEMPGIARAAAG